MGIWNNIAEAIETKTRKVIIQATKIVLMEPVITATCLDIRNNIAISNRGTNKQVSVELVITATSLDRIKKIS